MHDARGKIVGGARMKKNRGRHGPECKRESVRSR